MRSISALATEALQIQYASNLSGLAHSFSKVISELHENLPDAGTATISRHPITKMWVYKLHALARGECLCDSCYQAWLEMDKECRKLTEVSVEPATGT